MPVDEASAHPRWRVYGINFFRRDRDTDEWRQITTPEETPCQEALWLYGNLLLQLPEPASYEWKEGDVRFRAERWSDKALEVVRRDMPYLFQG